MDDHIARHAAPAGAIGEHSSSSAANFYAVRGRDILLHGVVVNTKMRRERRATEACWWMRGKDDAALKRVVLKDIVSDQIVVAFRSFVAD